MTDEITINYITYKVRMRKTVEDFEAEGLHNIARMMRGNKNAAQLYLQRPRGKRMYYSVETVRGFCTNPISIGNW